MNFLRRAAPLAILASGQLFVLVSGGFDLSVGSLITLDGDRRIDADRQRSVENLVGDRRALWHRARRRADQRRGRGLSPDAFDHRDARHAALGQWRRNDVVGRLAARLSARQFPHVRPLRLPRRAGHQDLPDRRRRACRRLRPRLVGAACDRLRAKGLRGRRQCARRRACGSPGRLRAARRLRHLRALRGHGGIMLGGFGGVSVDVGLGPRAAGYRGLRHRRRSVDGRPRHARRRGCRRPQPVSAFHAAHSARPAAAPEGHGARPHSDFGGGVRRMAPAADG